MLRVIARRCALPTAIGRTPAPPSFNRATSLMSVTAAYHQGGRSPLTSRVQNSFSSGITRAAPASKWNRSSAARSSLETPSGPTPTWRGRRRSLPMRSTSLRATPTKPAGSTSRARSVAFRSGCLARSASTTPSSRNSTLTNSPSSPSTTSTPPRMGDARCVASSTKVRRQVPTKSAGWRPLVDPRFAASLRRNRISHSAKLKLRPAMSGFVDVDATPRPAVSESPKSGARAAPRAPTSDDPPPAIAPRRVSSPRKRWSATE
mmetsp:Transcript_9106/g.31231  ORF Transcript_9106/g.31231 Transcript_9106/m.31231 type:complete len:262 (-) Transcript_9106:4-789(-)